jgi:hypothetical protein
MLSAQGGQFDEDDTIYTDIYKIDGVRQIHKEGERETAVVKPENCPFGGVYGHHFERQGKDYNQGMSSYIGVVKKDVEFRIFVYGDNWVGASYFIMELGEFTELSKST